MKIKAFPMRCEIWKGRKKIQQKAVDRVKKAHALPPIPLKPIWNKSLFSVLWVELV